MDALEEKYALAEKAAQEHLRRLDMISFDIKRLESFLKRAGFMPFSKKYLNEEDVETHLVWTGSRLVETGTPLIETKVATRIRVHPLIGDFIESISAYHMKLGGNNETN